MGWGLTQKHQEEKIEFEIPDDVKAKIEAGEKASLALVELNSRFEAKDTELSTLKAELAEIKAAIVASKTVNVTDSKGAEDEIDFFSDPKSAVDKAIGKNLMPVVNAFAEMRAEKIMEDLRKVHPELAFADMTKEFDAVVGKFNIANRANRELMENTFRVTRDKLREQGKLDSAEYNNFMELSRQGSGHGDSSGSGNDKKAKSKKFTTEEQAFLARYNITDQEASDYLNSRRLQ